MARHNDLGKRGEALARQYLEQKGWHILAVNWRSGKAEIDLVARVGKVLVFVEVKTRRSARSGPPDAAVTRAKARRLTAAAAMFMDEVGHDGEVRFDVVSVLLPPGQGPRLHHIEDAFFF